MVNKSYSEVFRWYAFGIDADNRLVKRYFSSRPCAERWANANLVDVFRIDKE